MIQDTGKRDGAAHSVCFSVKQLQRDGEEPSNTDKESCAFTLWLMMDAHSKVQTRIPAASFGQEFSDHRSKPLLQKNMFYNRYSSLFWDFFNTFSLLPSTKKQTPNHIWNSPLVKSQSKGECLCMFAVLRIMSALCMALPVPQQQPVQRYTRTWEKARAQKIPRYPLPHLCNEDNTTFQWLRMLWNIQRL